MTKLRPIGSRHEAIVRVCDRLGYAHVSELIGKTESYIRQCSDPDAHHELQAREAAILDAACKAEFGETPFADWLTRSNNSVEWAGPRMDLRDAAFDVSIAQGRLCEAIRAAKSPTGPGGHRITPAEKAACLKLVHSMQNKLNHIVRELGAEDNVVGITG